MCRRNLPRPEMLSGLPSRPASHDMFELEFLAQMPTTIGTHKACQQRKELTAGSFWMGLKVYV